MQKISTFLSLTLIALLSACSLTGKVPKIRYFTLEQVPGSCFKSVQIEGKEYLLGERLIVRRAPHQIGNLPDAYWISALKNQLSEVITAADASKTLKLVIEDYSLEATNMTVVLKGRAKVCSNSECNIIYFTNTQKVSSSEPFFIVSAMQKGLEEVVTKDLCLE